MKRPSAAMIILAAGFVVLLFNSGSRFSLGLLLKPMADDLGWSRTTLSLPISAFMVVGALSLPFIGRLVDRLGARAVLAGATILSGASLAAMYLMTQPVHALVLYGILFALGNSGTSITPIGVLVTQWFPARAGLANSIAISGMGVGQLLIITALASQLDVVGWRGAFMTLGVANLAILLPLVLIILRPRRDGEHAPAAAPAPGTAIAPLRNPHLWLLLAVFGICGFQDFFAATHVVAFALDEGLSTGTAGNLLAFMGLFGLVGVLAGGGWADRAGPVWPTFACFILRCVIFTAVLASREPLTIMAFALLYGATFWVTAPLTVVFVKEGFGGARLGTLTGLVTMVHHVAGGLGAYAGAAVFDATGSYDRAFWLMLGLSVLAAGLTLALRVTRPR